MIRIFIALAVTYFWMVNPSWVDATYDSIANAVDSAQAQAYVTLAKGTYRSRTGDADVRWVIPTDEIAKVSFRYGAGTLQAARIDFGMNPTFATFRTSDGNCTRFKITRVI